MGIWTDIVREAKELGGNGKGSPLISVATAWGLLVGTSMIYPVILPYLQTSYGLSLTVSGLLFAVLRLSGAIGQLPGGVLADRYNERTLMASSMMIAAVALGFVTAAPTALVLFLGTSLLGIGHSMYPVARITFLSNLYNDRLGSALGVTMAFGDIGQAVLPPVAAVLAVAIGWQVGLGFVAPLLVLAGVVIVITLPAERPRKRPVDKRSLWDMLDVLSELRNPAMGFMAGVLFLYIFIWYSFTAFYPTYLTEVKHLSSSVAGVLFGFFFAMGVVVKPVAGVAYDRIGMHRSLVGVLLPAVAGFVLLPLTDNVWLLAGITGLISIMLGSGAIMQSYLADSFSEERRGSGLGVVRTATATLGAGGPLIFGVVADFGYYDQGYTGFSLILAAVVIIIFRMPRSKR